MKNIKKEIAQPAANEMYFKLNTLDSNNTEVEAISNLLFALAFDEELEQKEKMLSITFLVEKLRDITADNKKILDTIILTSDNKKELKATPPKAQKK